MLILFQFRESETEESQLEFFDRTEDMAKKMLEMDEEKKLGKVGMGGLGLGAGQ